MSAQAKAVTISDGQEVQVSGMRLRGYSRLKQAVLRELGAWPGAKGDAPIQVLLGAAIAANAPELIGDSTDLSMDEVLALSPADGDELLGEVLALTDMRKLTEQLMGNLTALGSAFAGSGGDSTDSPPNTDGESTPSSA